MKSSRLVPVVLAVLTACNPRAPQTSAVATPSPGPSSEAIRIVGRGSERMPIRIVQQRGNRRQYELIARSYESNGPRGRARTTFEMVHVTFFARDGSRMIADAPRAIVDEAANTVTLQPK